MQRPCVEFQSDEDTHEFIAVYFY